MTSSKRKLPLLNFYHLRSNIGRCSHEGMFLHANKFGIPLLFELCYFKLRRVFNRRSCSTTYCLFVDSYES